MMPMTRAIRLAISAAILAAFGCANASPAQPVAQAAERGKQLFMSDNCYLCHGTVGQGGAGPTLAPPRLMPQSGFSAYVRHPKVRMPPYTQAVLSDTDLTAIYAYLQSLPQPPAELPMLLSGAPAAGH
jgi:ubiquinol-cytochrome c reductase cytochrome c subunit